MRPESRLPPVSAGRIARRIEDLGRVPAKETAAAVARAKVEGREVLPLYGGPYWLPPAHVQAAAAAAVAETSPAPASGLPELRHAIARKVERDNRLSVDPERQVLVTNAAMHALNLVMGTLLDPGDEVLMYSPVFFFHGVIELAGGIPTYARMSEDDGWRWHIDALERAVTPRTRVLLLTTPTNPTGYVATADDLAAVADLARRHDLLIVSDEAFSKMVYDGRRHLSIGGMADARDRTVTIFSLTKDYAMKPWRVGYVVAPPDLTPHLLRVLEWNVLQCNLVAQRAAQAALEGPQAWTDEIAPRYQRSRDLMVDALRAAPALGFAVPGGAPFVFLNVSRTGVSGADFSRTLLRDHGVATDPGGAFGSDAHVRLLFGGEDAVVREAGRRVSLAATTLAASR